VVLSQGKAVEIDTRRPLWTGIARTDAPAELLILFGWQGERIGHQQLRTATEIAERDNAEPGRTDFCQNGSDHEAGQPPRKIGFVRSARDFRETW
jgi:hypothetical protein